MASFWAVWWSESTTWATQLSAVTAGFLLFHRKGGRLNSEEKTDLHSNKFSTGELFLTRLKQETKNERTDGKCDRAQSKPKHRPAFVNCHTDWVIEEILQASVILLPHMSPARTVWPFLIDNSTMAQQRVRLHWCVRRLAQEMKCKNTKTG